MQNEREYTLKDVIEEIIELKSTIAVNSALVKQLPCAEHKQQMDDQRIVLARIEEAIKITKELKQEEAENKKNEKDFGFKTFGKVMAIISFFFTVVNAIVIIYLTKMKG